MEWDKGCVCSLCPGWWLLDLIALAVPERGGIAVFQNGVGTYGCAGFLAAANLNMGMDSIGTAGSFGGDQFAAGDLLADIEIVIGIGV